MNAKVLDIMEFGLVEKSFNGCDKDKWRLSQNKLLQFEDRASRDSRFVFKKFSSTTWKNDNDIHDLSMIDLFASSFLDGYDTF